MIIRAAVPADLPAIGSLGALLVREHYEFDRQRFLEPGPQTPQLYASFLGSQLDDERVLVLVAEAEGPIAGYVYAGLEPTDYMALRGPAGAIYDIVVDPAFRQQGIGRRLLDAAIDVLVQRGAPRIVLSTAEKNEPAQRLFAKVGFRRTMIEMTREAKP